MINIADSRFQRGLLRSAQAVGKIPSDYSIPEIHRNNTPERLERALSSHRRSGLFSEYPFGTDLSTEEISLARALRHLKASTASPIDKLVTLARAMFMRAAAADQPALRRMALGRADRPVDPHAAAAGSTRPARHTAGSVAASLWPPLRQPSTPDQRSTLAC